MVKNSQARLRAPTSIRTKKVRLPVLESKPAKPPRLGSKLAKLLALMRRPTGASLGELVQVTGWHEHSVRSAISAYIRIRMGLQVTSVKAWGQQRRYYVTSANGPISHLVPVEGSRGA